MRFDIYIPRLIVFDRREDMSIVLVIQGGDDIQGVSGKNPVQSYTEEILLTVAPGRMQSSPLPEPCLLRILSTL